MAIKLWLTLAVTFMLFLNLAKAESLFTTVFNVYPSSATERLLVLSGADGRIYKIPKNKETEALMKSLLGQVVKLEYREAGSEALITNITLANPAEVDPTVMDLNHFQYNELRKFAPTDLQTLEKATDIFNNMMNDGDKSRSQCFKRAHIWAYDMWSQLGINSEKIFIFYTRRYIDLEEFEWWFHVAPLVTVNGQKYAMDGTFMKYPVSEKEWIKRFIHTDKITCPVVEDYRTFEKNQWSRLCYIMKVPMYHFRPLDIQNRDEGREKRNNWILDELQDARRAFKDGEKTYEGLDTGKWTKKY